MMPQWISKSLLVKILLIMLSFTAICIITTVMIQREFISKKGLESFALSRNQMADIFIEDIQDAIRFSRPDLVEQAFKKNQEKPENTLHGIILFDANKKIVLRKGDEDHLVFIETEIAKHPNHLDTSRTEFHGPNEMITLFQINDGSTKTPIGYVALAWSKELLWEALDEEVLTNAIFIATLLLFNIGIALVIVRYIILSPLNKMQRQMSELSEGNTNLNVDYVNRSDEIGQMGRALLVFKDNLISNRKLENEQKELEIRAEERRKEAMHNLANAFETRMQGIISAVTTASSELEETAEHMNSSIDQSVETISNTENESRETSSYVDRVAGAANELYSSVSEISQQVHKANELISGSVYKVQSADVHAKKLGEASDKVREVIQLIADISSQINLLALNATIESARAGEAGKGFAVVANEVKNLANQTNKSLEEIGKVIDEMGTVSVDIIKALGGVRDAVNDISQSSVGIASAVEEQTVATNGIAQSAKEASQGAQNIYSGLSVIKNTSYEVTSSSKRVLDAARGLALQSEDLNTQVHKFIEEIRSS